MTVPPDQKAIQIVLNLWYICDDMGAIYRIMAKPYLESGPDEEILIRLRLRARIDYWIARQFELPKQYHTKVVSEEGQRTVPAILAADHKLLEPLSIFEDALETISTELPRSCPFELPWEPLVVITPLMCDDHGNLFPQFTKRTPF